MKISMSIFFVIQRDSFPREKNDIHILIELNVALNRAFIVKPENNNMTK